MMTVARPSPLHGLATRLGLGGAARRYFHEPFSHLRQSIDEGGPLEQWRTARARAEMIAAARRLSSLAEPPGEGALEVHFLTGKAFWWQTLFCIMSLQTHSSARIAPIIHDDGSLSDEMWHSVARVIPRASLETASAIEARLDTHLPARRFPALRARRLVYPHLRKLTDIHAGRSGWTAVLDSDMLFYRPPLALLSWLEGADRPCCLVESVSAYGYAPELLRELAGLDVPSGVNVGVCGLRSEAIDWDRLEWWCAETLRRAGSSYLQEQALTAMLLAGQEYLRLGPPDYVVKPDLEEGRRPNAALHHYVSSSKRSYFQFGWRRALADARAGKTP